MSKAKELLEQIKEVEENKYHKTRTIIFNSDDMEFLEEAIVELEAQKDKSCDNCYYSNMITTICSNCIRNKCATRDYFKKK